MGTTSSLAESPVSAKYGLCIGGQWVETDKQDEVKLPYDGSVVGWVGRATAVDVDAAVAAAAMGARDMAALANYERADLLLRIADEIRK